MNVVTMGCSKNLVDSEVLLSHLDRAGFEVSHDSDKPGFEAVFINTCGFIHDAKQESVDMILDYAEAKKRGAIGKLYVMGCLSERYAQELAQEIPEADRFFGKFALEAILEEMGIVYRPAFNYKRKITTPGHYAYLKVSEGCNRSCAFCAIPMMTGRYQSKSIEDLRREAEDLAAKGVRELLLIAQDLSYYGFDLYGESRLKELMEILSEIKGIEWIRLHYLYPAKFPYEILPVMRENPRVCRYLDIPLQHISGSVLKRMRRGVSSEQIRALIRKIRQEVPEAVIRTTILVGFPGESEADFEELKKFVRETRFDRLGVFPYSHEEGTYAGNTYPDDVPEEVKQVRADEIMEIQRSVSAGLAKQKTGKTFRVVIDRREGDAFIGRTEYDSPEVDGEVIVTSGSPLQTGEFYSVKITGALDYDLLGMVIP